jgi:hypothetical protein
MHNQVRHTLLRCGAMILVQPGPRFLFDNHANATPRNSVFFGNFSLKENGLQGANFANIALGQFGLSVSLSKLMGSVVEFICVVGRRSFPRQMHLRNATIMAFATTMSSLMFRGWRGTIYMLTNKTVNVVISAIQHNIAVSIASSRIRPGQTFAAIVGEDYFSKVAARFTTRRSAGGWIAMPVPPLVVPPAEAASTSGYPMSIAIAVIYRTCFEVYSHFRSFRDRSWLEPVAALERSAGSLILHDKSASYNAGAV